MERSFAASVGPDPATEASWHLQRGRPDRRRRRQDEKRVRKGGKKKPQKFEVRWTVNHFSSSGYGFGEEWMERMTLLSCAIARKLIKVDYVESFFRLLKIKKIHKSSICCYKKTKEITTHYSASH